MTEIFFNSEDTSFTLSNQQAFVDWIFCFSEVYNKQPAELSFVFCSDEYLLKINQEYLEHDYYTDIITFDYCQDKLLLGDIFISVDRVKDNAAEFKVTFEEELKRVMAHGVLHLIGFKDKSEDDIVKMRDAENKAIALFS